MKVATYGLKRETRVNSVGIQESATRLLPKELPHMGSLLYSGNPFYASGAAVSRCVLLVRRRAGATRNGISIR